MVSTGFIPPVLISSVCLRLFVENRIVNIPLRITGSLIEVRHVDVLLSVLASSLATLALKDVLSVLVQLQLGDLHLGGIKTNLGSRTVRLLGGEALDVDDPLLSVDFHDLSLLALVGTTEHLHLITLHDGHGIDLYVKRDK